VLHILLAWSPVILIAVLAIGFRRSALDLGVAGLAWCLMLAPVAFDTPFKLVLLALVDGFLTTLPLLLVVYGGILLSALLVETGSLSRLARWLTGATKNSWDRLALLTMGMGNTLEGAGIIAEPVAAPVLRASGLSPSTSAALSIIGYSGLMTLALGGVIITVMVNVTGYPAAILARYVAVLSIPATVMMAWLIPYYAGQPRDLFRKLPYLTLMGLIPGVTALGTVMLAGYQIAAMMGGIVVTIVIVAPRIRELKPDRVILRDMAPFLVMGGGLLTANLLPVYRDWVRTVLVWTVEVVPGHVVYFRPLSDAYLYLLAAFVAGYLLLECDGTLIGFFRKGTIQGYKTLVAMALFGSMGQVISFTGATAGMGSVNAAKNIPAILADSMAGAGFLYPVLVPVLGWVGTFLTGYGVASIMLFAVLQKGIALRLGVSPELLIAGLAVGASLGSISSPFKIAFAASLSDAGGMEGDILRSTIPLGILVCLALGVVLYLMV